MLDQAFLLQFALEVAHWFELAGILVIIAGALFAFVRLALAVARLEHLLPGPDTEGTPVAGFRSTLGRSILTGLELLVAGDIIQTVAMEPTIESVLVLGGIVLIRTFLSFSLEVEIEGRWPWQRGRRREQE